MNKITKYIFRLLRSSVKVFFLRLRGASIGNRVLIGNAKFRTSPKNIVIGDAVVIGNGVVFDQLKSIEIRDYVKIHDRVQVENGTDGEACLSISNNSWVGSETILNCERDVIIEGNVGIGARSQVWTHGYFPSVADGFPSKHGTVTIKEGAWLPPSCIVLPDVVVGEYAVIGTGSVITKDIPNRVFATGTPCKVKSQEDVYRESVSPEEKITRVLEGCCKNISLKGGTIQQEAARRWRCTFLFKRFTFAYLPNPDDWIIEKGDMCLFVWGRPNNIDQVPKNITLFILSENRYIKQGTLHEWIIMRALLDSCTLRLMPL